MSHISHCISLQFVSLFQYICIIEYHWQIIASGCLTSLKTLVRENVRMLTNQSDNDADIEE